MKKKMAYEKPEMTQLQVSLESPICAGSVDITAQAPAVQTEAQTINKDFGTANDFTTGTDTSWDTTTE